MAVVLYDLLFLAIFRKKIMFIKNNKIQGANFSLTLFTAFLVTVNLIIGYILMPTELIQPDSQGYISFDSSRTLGYPIFLWCIHSIFKTYAVVPVFQLFIYAVASYKLATSVKNISRNAVIPFLLLALLWLNPGWTKCHFQIMTESVSVSLLCFFVASLIKAHLTGSYRSLLYAGIFFALGIAIRPINLHYLPVFIGAFYFFYKKNPNVSWKNIGIAITVPIALYALNSGANSYVYKDARGPSFFAYNFLGKVGFFATPDVPSTEPQFIKQLSERTHEFREMINQNESIQNYYQLTACYSDIIRYGILGKIELSPEQFNDKSFYTKRAVEIIKHYPWLYAKDVAIQFAALWLLLDVKMPSEKLSINSLIETFFIDKNSDVCAEIYFNKRLRPAWQAISIRSVFGTLFLMTLLGLLIPLARPKWMKDTRTFAFSLASYIIQSGYICIAMSHNGYTRYAVALWPALFITICLALDYALCLVKKHNGHA